MIIDSPVVIGRVLIALTASSRSLGAVIAVYGALSGKGIGEGCAGSRKSQWLVPADCLDIELVVSATLLIDCIRVEIGIGAYAQLAEY